MTEHYRSGAAAQGCAYVIFLAIEIPAAALCLWAVLGSHNPLLTIVGLIGLFGVVVSGGSIVAGFDS